MPYADTALAAFGPNRLLFGSDWPVCTLEADYDEVVSIAAHLTEALNPDERAAVLFGNARHVYRLSAPAGRTGGTMLERSDQ